MQFPNQGSPAFLKELLAHTKPSLAFDARDFLMSIPKDRRNFLVQGASAATAGLLVAGVAKGNSTETTSHLEGQVESPQGPDNNAD